VDECADDGKLLFHAFRKGSDRAIPYLPQP
jgi:hypothetical protein